MVSRAKLLFERIHSGGREHGPALNSRRLWALHANPGHGALESRLRRYRRQRTQVPPPPCLRKSLRHLIHLSTQTRMLGVSSATSARPTMRPGQVQPLPSRLPSTSGVCTSSIRAGRGGVDNTMHRHGRSFQSKASHHPPSRRYPRICRRFPPCLPALER